jgi:hypothetical protein
MAAAGPIGAAREAQERRDAGGPMVPPPHGAARPTARSAPGEAEVVAMPRRPRGGDG